MSLSECSTVVQTEAEIETELELETKIEVQSEPESESLVSNPHEIVIPVKPVFQPAANKDNDEKRANNK